QGMSTAPTVALGVPALDGVGRDWSVNEVYPRQIEERPPVERPAYIQAQREAYAQDIDLLRLATELVVDEIVPPQRLREELVRRFAFYGQRRRERLPKHHGVHPV